ncbi:M48 family metallopeptidase [Aeromicrobium sp. CFBP 8757]|nr:M48 family metallopeptidase [Aeromicrobium sp. CFBP 8757]
MLVLAGVSSVVAVAVFIVLVATNADQPGWLTSAVVLIVLGPLLAGLFFIRYMYWTTISNGVEVTPRQLPQLYELFAELGGRLSMTPDGEGLLKLPRLYVTNGNGVFNAYATKCRIRRGYVVIYSDLLDIAYLNGDFETIRFVLGHELGHIHCRHVSVWRTILRPISTILQIGPSVSRAQEYSADRVGSLLAPEGVMGMIGLFAGKHMSKHVDIDAYFDSVADHEDGFWLKLANFRADHAVGFRRMTALRRVPDEGWDVHGRML